MVLGIGYASSKSRLLVFLKLFVDKANISSITYVGFEIRQNGSMATFSIRILISKDDKNLQICTSTYLIEAKLHVIFFVSL